MSYENMSAMLSSAGKGGYAVGAFNILDTVTIAAAISAAEGKRSPIILQTSPKTINLFGFTALAAVARDLGGKASVPVALHLDHCKDLKLIEGCIENGWSSVMVDASAMPFEENVRLTSRVVEMAHRNGVSVEGELGAIVGVEDDIHVREQDSHLADPVQAVEYVRRTGVDAFAPAIGTAHGFYKGEPKIAFDLLREIAASVPAAIAIHGGTGLSDEVFAQCIRLGGRKINISTQLKKVFLDSIRGYMQEHPECAEPVTVLSSMREKIRATVETFLEKFGSIGKA